MKVIAITQENNPGKYLVEVSSDELNRITCYKVPSRIRIGTVINVEKIFDAAARILANERTVSEATKKLRAMAEMIESVEPNITAAVYAPEDVENPDET
jgi:hypothetical protein